MTNLSDNVIDNRVQSSVVTMKGIVKRFPRVTALDCVDFAVKEGEIHALLGENGAGKTTLMKILTGIYHADTGEIYFKGEKIKLTSLREASKFGISIVHQHSTLIGALSIVENMLLSIGSPKEPFLNFKYFTRFLRNLVAKYDFAVNLTAKKASDLAVGERQRVEILRSLAQGAKVLILDEPTTILTPIEVDRLFEILRRLTEEGTSVIFISHKLDEVLAISDRITVLRKGKVVGNLLIEDTTREKLAKLMVGRNVLFEINRSSTKLGNPLLTVEDLTVRGAEKALVVSKASFSVHEGEILGVAGISGNGQTELVEAIAGLRKIASGRVAINGKDVTNLSAQEIRAAGLGLIPEDVLEMGIVKDWTLRDNLIMGFHDRKPFAGSGPLRWLRIDLPIFRNEQAIDEFCHTAIERFSIIASGGGRMLAQHLSGGNLQKLVLAREILQNVSILIACQPTQGLDVGAAEYVRTCLLKHKENGNAVLLISEDLDEIKMLSDRIAVIYKGEILGIVPPDTEVESIGLLMGGRSVSTPLDREDSEPANSVTPGERKNRQQRSW